MFLCFILPSSKYQIPFKQKLYFVEIHITVKNFFIYLYFIYFLHSQYIQEPDFIIVIIETVFHLN